MRSMALPSCDCPSSYRPPGAELRSWPRLRGAVGCIEGWCPRLERRRPSPRIFAGAGSVVTRATGCGPALELAGVVNLSEIVRGPFQSAYLGYYAFPPHDRQGYMARGLAAVLQEAFRTLRLHRVEANVQPGNTASRRLIRRLGFRREGYSPKYLKISGRWRDHERWALTIEDWRARRGPT